MSDNLDLSHYQTLIYPMICQLSEHYGADTDLLEQAGQLILWQLVLHYPHLLSDDAYLLGYVQERLYQYLCSYSGNHF